MLLEEQFQITVFKLDNNGLEALGDLTQYTSIKWPRAFIGCGSFEVWAPINEENVTYFRKENILWNNSDSAVIVECVKETFDEDGVKSFDVKGRTLERYLMDRIIWGTVAYYNKKASTIMYSIVNSQCINPTNPNRKIPWLVLDEDSEVGLTIDSYQKTGGQVYDALESLATDSDIGFSIYPDRTLMRLVFTVNAGVDRTIENTDGNNPLVFETDLQDILSSSYYTNDEDLKTVAFVQGEDTGEERKSTIVGRNSDSGFDRRELYVDARDIQSEIYDDSGQSIVLTDEEYMQMLSQRGSEKLSEYYTVETFEAVIRQFGEVQYVYGVDFFLGDKVTVVDNELGVMVSARIMEVEEDISSSRRELLLKFGYSYPTILNKLKRETN